MVFAATLAAIGAAPTAEMMAAVSNGIPTAGPAK